MCRAAAGASTQQGHRLAVFWLQTALKNEKSGAARAYSTRPSWADCGVFSLTGLHMYHSGIICENHNATRHTHTRATLSIHAKDDGGIGERYSPRVSASHQFSGGRGGI
jgi:hypothetical protein